MDPCSGRQLIGEMAVNSHSHSQFSQLVSLNQTRRRKTDEPTTRAGPPGMRVPRGNQALTSAEDVPARPQEEEAYSL